MAATQAQTQQNDVKDPSQLSANSFQNGTENIRTGLVSDVISAKGKKPVRNIPVELDMSQYRQEAGPPVNNSEHNANSEDGKGGPDKQFSHPEGEFGKPPPDSANMQYGLGYQRGGYPMHGDGSNPMHMGEGMQHQNSYGHFNPVRHPYPGPKGARPVHGAFPQRFMPGQQPTATTPTLSHLLQQTSNSVHRYQNSYGEYGGIAKPGEQPQPTNMGGYNQGWAPRPMAPYPQQPSPYRQQPPPVSPNTFAYSITPQSHR
ncbi:hypothetical protein GE061_019871 [Apolygus lucorum]|uniref:Uncharacterized protein n=1 Tax=Apolygus lucorum TaxID=248454 RepID=A0A8S9XBQ3_APOLU|nr:hypothetical protein GE061_019871 [Apolygus lucorum]